MRMQMQIRSIITTTTIIKSLRYNPLSLQSINHPIRYFTAAAAAATVSTVSIPNRLINTNTNNTTNTDNNIDHTDNSTKLNFSLIKSTIPESIYNSYNSCYYRLSSLIITKSTNNPNRNQSIRTEFTTIIQLISSLSTNTTNNHSNNAIEQQQYLLFHFFRSLYQSTQSPLSAAKNSYKTYSRFLYELLNQAHTTGNTSEFYLPILVVHYPPLIRLLQRIYRSSQNYKQLKINFQYLKQLNQSNIPTIADYHYLLDELATIIPNNNNSAADITAESIEFQSLVSDYLLHYSPTDGLYNILIKSGVKFSNWQEIMQLYNTMKSSTNTAIQPNRITYIQLIDSAGRIGSIESIESITVLLNEMQSLYNIKPDIAIYSTIIEAYSRNNCFLNCLAIFESIFININTDSSNNSNNNTILCNKLYGSFSNYIFRHRQLGPIIQSIIINENSELINNNSNNGNTSNNYRQYFLEYIDIFLRPDLSTVVWKNKNLILTFQYLLKSLKPYIEEYKDIPLDGVLE